MLTQIFMSFLLQVTYFAAQVAIVTVAGLFLIAAYGRMRQLLGR